MAKLSLPIAMATIAAAFITQPLAAQWEHRAELLEKVEKTFGAPPGMVRLDPKSRVWADKKNKRIVVDGYIALTAGQLEMLACPVGTKEHESVVAVFSKAQVVHAGLLAVGAKQGKPVQWEPTYQPPTGSEVRVYALWFDEAGKKQHVDTRQWVRVVGTEDKTLDVNFVFAGSMFWKDPETGEERYQAESGDLICVSNFSTATLDVPMRSSQVNSGLLFSAFTQRIPEVHTPIRLVLQVVEETETTTAKEQTQATKPDVQPASSAASEQAKEVAEDLNRLIPPPE